MKKFYVFILCCSYIISATAQIRENESSIKVHLGTSNFWAGLLGTGIMAAIIPYAGEEQWVSYMPVYDWMIGVSSSTNPANMEKAESRSGYFDAPWENGLGDGYAGLEYRFSKIFSHIGFVLDLDYKNKGIKIGNNRYTAHTLSPSASLSIKIGSLFSKAHPILEFGGGYDYVFGYSGNPEYDKNMFSCGCFAKASFGIAIPHAHSAIVLQYQRDFYNFFNQKYSKNEVAPFNGYKRNNAYIMIKLTHYWNNN